MELKPFIEPENYLIEFSRITQSTPEQFRLLAGLCEDLRTPDQAEQGAHEMDEIFVMRILFNVPPQETAGWRIHKGAEYFGGTRENYPCRRYFE